ncbi:ribosome maturation factor RimP [Bombilactobacillus folatiphilus]|uniref:Ribosome maturation factor RimP n=1 Tax=Bombilactobacillus folatiphilus TaxID=2923362 RepID=A0ABY4P7J8_9LACO|nr:ribosome maturation factor RimP [Bombilactobacillus folatiphilus]UQS81584.1 ribosome maturation factor RimP [Bombilactobacillus folatiphilus]
MISVTEKVTQLVQPILHGHDFYLVDLEYVKEAGSWYLRLYIDKPGGIDIEECAVVSQELSDQLDVQDPEVIPNAYFLEVSSPGAERPLKTQQDLQAAVNQYIHVSLYQKLEGNKVFEGTLLAYDDDQLTLEIKIKSQTKKLIIPRRQIAAIRLAIEF